MCWRTLITTSRRSFAACLTVFNLLAFAGTLRWASVSDPFERREFAIATPQGPKVRCFQISAKSSKRPRPVVLFLPGVNGDPHSNANDLRAMAELGFTAIGIDYDQTSLDTSESQLLALLKHLEQKFALDRDRFVVVGFGLGIQHALSFIGRHPKLAPPVLVLLSTTSDPAPDTAPTLHAHTGSPDFAPRLRILLLHWNQEELAGPNPAEHLVSYLRHQKIPVRLHSLSSVGHDFADSQPLVFRGIAEACLAELDGPGALPANPSINEWRTSATPIWFYELPAFAWLCYWGWLRRQSAAPSQRQPNVVIPRPGRSSLRLAATALALAATIQTAFHLLPFFLPVSALTLKFARALLVQSAAAADFDFLANLGGWPKARLSTLLQHLDLARYNRQLSPSKCSDEFFTQHVLSPAIDDAVDGPRRWRRILWESLYPRVRNLKSADAAAQVISNHLRARVTVAPGDHLPLVIEQIWRRQLTNPRGFEALCVAAFRATGIPARLDDELRAEFWTGRAWRRAPRPAFEAGDCVIGP